MSIDTNYRNSSRRHFLRGVGVALALPWMESLPIFAQSAAPGAGAAAAGTPPLRLGIVFFSNGVEPAHWWAKGAGASMEIGPALTPMMPHREDMLFINGLFNQTALASTSPHLGRMNVLSGATVSLDPKEIRVGTSMDQVLASQIGSRTAIPSLVLGIEPNELGSKTAVDDLRLEPVVGLADQAGDQGDLSRARRSIASSATAAAAARSQHPRRGAPGLAEPAAEDQPRRQLKLSEYFESIRDIEKRIERAARKSDRGLAADAGAARHAAPGQRAAAERPGSHEADARSDRARVPDGQDARRDADAQQRPVADELQVPRRRARARCTSTDPQRQAADKEAMYLKTNQYHIAQFAYLTQRMKDIKEGEGTLLDNSMLVCTSSLFDGDAHSANQLPILITGKGGGTLKPGRVLDYLEKGDDNRRACSLHLSLMDRMGVKLEKFGDTSRAWQSSRF
jgi:hypothetical protein